MATGFQVVFAVFAAVIPLIAFPAFYLFFKHKSSAVIYNRSFWSVVIQISGLTLYGFIGCVRYATLTLACAPTIVVQYSMLTMHLFALVERCVVLIASYEISMEARAYAEAKQEHRENIKIGWFLRNRKYFHHGLHSPTKLAVAVITVINVIISIAISKTTLGEFTETETEACKVMSSKISGLNNYFLGFAFLAMVVCSWRLYKVRENFGIRRELRNIAIMAAICIVWIVVANKIPSLKDSLPNVFYHIAIPVFELYFSLITVIRMARRNEASSRKKSEERRSSAPQNNNLSQASAADNSTNSGAHPVRSKFVNALMEIMSDDRRSREFELYMIHEFAVENLYFLRAVDEFHDASKDPKMEGEPLAKMAEAIYDKFCAPDSRLCINISSANRIELKAAIANIGVMHQISSNVFDNAKKEIINLICQDTLRRFLRAEDANKKGPASVTGTSEMDRIPSGTGAKSSSVPVQTEAGANV